MYADARQTLARGLKVSPQTLSRLSGPKNLRDGVFPADARPVVSLASLSLPSLPSLPSFASIRKSVAPPREAPPEPTLFAATLPPAEPVAAPTTSGTRTGRGNLVNIFQDSRQR